VPRGYYLLFFLEACWHFEIGEIKKKWKIKKGHHEFAAASKYGSKTLFVPKNLKNIMNLQTS
jgi:hypothetical protein